MAEFLAYRVMEGKLALKDVPQQLSRQVQEIIDQQKNSPVLEA